MTGRGKDAPFRYREAIAALTPQLRGFARFLARDATRADDLVQETLLRALEHEASWQDGTDLRAWLFRILRNAFLDQARRSGTERRALGALDADAAQPATQPGIAELGELGRAIAALPAAQREAILLVAALEFTVAEAAAVTGLPEGTLKARVSRARDALARQLGPRR
ncbi:sigma-70 family RNA polymerase sigma factor [Roseomonas sp. CECT 9278]|uniref:sigma-70 family RNA polymerase sigma factor n=1 Tax=Roseomonas sp. CECT 9278 TaxID=2845823 RepID=UPI001E2EB074|nr:sigma-70 family RNA polymerase sigma factor [Roseomonas sp. CECT 9278]CAH0261198.1 ECF RNA polymerase sigma factor EcfG [Roseomonas sp. CECT 9278]